MARITSIDICVCTPDRGNAPLPAIVAIRSLSHHLLEKFSLRLVWARRIVRIWFGQICAFAKPVYLESKQAAQQS